MTKGKKAYEADLAKKPNYHDGTKRKTWQELPEFARWSWEKYDSNITLDIFFNKKGN